jgi:nitrate reductase beta subunit
MTFTLELSDEDLLGELMGALARQGCLTERVGPHACRVVCPRTWTAREAQLEIRLFVRAWQARHPGVEAVLSA